MTLSLFMHYVRLRMKERMEYRGAFLIGMGSQMLGYAASYLVIWLVLHRFDTINGWIWPEVAFLYSLNVFTYALGASFTYSQMTMLEEMVTRGTFDPVLIRPVNPYVSLAAQMFNVGYLGHILLAGGILAWALLRLDVAWTLPGILFLVGSVASGTLIQAAGLTLIGAWSFTQVRSGFLFSLHGTLREFLTYPISVYGTAIQVLLTTVVPLAFVNYYPSVILLGKDSGSLPSGIGWLTPLIGPLAFLGAYIVWMRGVNRYQGAGG